MYDFVLTIWSGVPDKWFWYYGLVWNNLDSWFLDRGAEFVYVAA